MEVVLEGWQREILISLRMRISAIQENAEAKIRDVERGTYNVIMDWAKEAGFPAGEYRVRTEGDNAILFLAKEGDYEQL